MLLDGAVGTELIEVSGERPEVEEHLWGVTATLDDSERVKQVHRRYVDTGCDLLSTNTWGLATGLHQVGTPQPANRFPVHWLDVARQGIRLVRAAAEEGGRAGECAVAFSLNGEIDSVEGQGTLSLLDRVFHHDEPDLILVETLSLVRPSTYTTVEALVALGLPVWLSFRRCRHGVCGVYGEHWGGPEGDSFGRSVRRFEEMGVAAVLINCVPPDHVPGMISWLRDFTDLPLGVYPNLGYLSAEGWRSETAIGGSEYASLALEWRQEGAQIIGGCCGVGPEHLAAAREALTGTETGNARVAEVAWPQGDPATRSAAARRPWTDANARRLFPLEFPDVVVEPDVFVPTQGSFLLWKYVFGESIGAGLRCLDVGCGTGLLAIQLALNGAEHVHALDIDHAAVSNTLTNAFRNGVGDRISAAAVDLFPWVPRERYDLVVASLYQMPVDPFEQVSTHRPLDYWGRNLLDRLISLLPDILTDDGVAYVLQLSIIGQERTDEQLHELGYRSRVVDFSFFEFHELFAQRSEHIRHVEELSDAYHLQLGDKDVMVAYLIEITRDSKTETELPANG